MKKVLLACMILLNLSTYPKNLFSGEAQQKSRSEIVSQLEKWPKAFNERNIPGVCALFAPDLVASYPGTTDRNFDEMCNHLSKILSDFEKNYRYDPPQIEQILVEGDMAVVRLIWTLKITNKNNDVLEVVRERGIDVLRRQSDGKWKIIVSYAYPQPS